MDIQIKIVYRGDKLQEKRKMRGLSQGQLAKVAGISVRAIQDYEQGKKDLNGARLSTILKLCVALGCKMEDVLNEPETLELLRAYGGE